MAHARDIFDQFMTPVYFMDGMFRRADDVVTLFVNKNESGFLLYPIFCLAPEKA
jgi:hypothetical protein